MGVRSDRWLSMHSTGNSHGTGHNKPDGMGGGDGARGSSDAPVVVMAEDSSLS